jgi:hypothetical protein
MRKKLNTGWIVMIFGLLLLAVVIGSLLRVTDLGEGTPTLWQEPVISTMTSEPATETPGWWDAKDTPPVWPTDSPETEGVAEE